MSLADNNTTTNKKIDNNTENETIVIDPPVNEYIRIANAEFGNRAKITKVFDTHLHADHVSSARGLVNKTDAHLYIILYEDYSQEVSQNQLHKQFRSLKETNITIREKTDKSIELQVMYTPGYTAGGLSFLVGEKLLFTGDTLFVDGIGRPDLRDKAEEFCLRLLSSRRLFQSIKERKHLIQLKKYRN